MKYTEDLIPFLYSIVLIESYTKNSSQELQQKLKSDLIQWGKAYYKKHNYKLDASIDKLNKPLKMTPELGKLVVNYHKRVEDIPILYDFAEFTYRLIGQHLDEIDPLKTTAYLDSQGLSLKDTDSKSESNSNSNSDNVKEGNSR